MEAAVSETTLSVCAQLEKQIGYEPRGMLTTQGTMVQTGFSQTLQTAVAVKIVDVRQLKATERERYARREVVITGLVRHPHVVRALTWTRSRGGEKVAIVSELMMHGSLLDRLCHHGPLSESDCRRLFRQLVEAVHYLHERHIVHRDIKLENILLDDDDNAKLIDFGFARFIGRSERSASFCGTKDYAAPELFKGWPYMAPPVDWYALGVVLFAMLVGRVPDDSLQFPSLVVVSPAVKQLVNALLEPDPNLRADYHYCIRSSWMRDQPWTWTDHHFRYEAL